MERTDKIFELLKQHHIKYKNRNLYIQALTHTSYSNENNIEKDYQRLEFIGDAVFQLVSANYIFNKYPNMKEGEMTKLRISLVREESLASVGRALNIPELMLLGRGEERTRGTKSKLIADCVESLLGAIYVDLGYAEAQRIGTLLLEKIHLIKNKAAITDYKSDLQEFIQSDSREPLKYIELNETGKDNDKTFYFAVMHNGIELGRGSGKTKKEAEQHAAQQALKKLAR